MEWVILKWFLIGWAISLPIILSTIVWIQYNKNSLYFDTKVIQKWLEGFDTYYHSINAKNHIIFTYLIALFWPIAFTGFITWKIINWIFCRVFRSNMDKKLLKDV